jgi:hypothetical protein
MDPDDRAMSFPRTRKCVAETVAAGGFVAKYMATACWSISYPQAHEDDAERSRSGLN